MTFPISNNHPISPPPELIQQWWDDIHGASYEFDAVVTQATRWGSDQELEACCEWVKTIAMTKPWDTVAQLALELRAARRPKPPSLKEQALQALYRFDDTEGHEGLTPEQIAEDFVLIRRALEALPNG